MKHWKSSALALAASASLIAMMGSVYAKTTAGAAHHSGFWASVASTLHVSPTQLSQAVKQAEISRLTHNAAAHHMSAQAVKRRTQQIEKGRLSVPKVSRSPGKTVERRVIHFSAGILNLKPGQVVHSLKSGQSLVQIAQSANLSAATLQADLVAKLEAPIQARVQAGKLSSTKASRLEAAITRQVGHLIGRRLSLKSRSAQHALWWGKAAANYLGISTSTLRADLRQGQSLSALATSMASQGKSTSGLQSALETAFTARMQKAVAHHHISTTRAQKLESHWNAHLATLINKTHQSKSQPSGGQ